MEKLDLQMKLKKKISSSNNPALVLHFGNPRTGKSTIASHFISGPSFNFIKNHF